MDDLPHKSLLLCSFVSFKETVSAKRRRDVLADEKEKRIKKKMEKTTQLENAMKKSATKKAAEVISFNEIVNLSTLC